MDMQHMLDIAPSGKVMVESDRHGIEPTDTSRESVACRAQGQIPRCRAALEVRRAIIERWMISDEPMLNVLLWKAKVTKQWCKYDLEPALYTRYQEKVSALTHSQHHESSQRRSDDLGHLSS
eukprot:3637300-Amphidinium_carterae.1